MTFGKVRISIVFYGEGKDENGYIVICSNPAYQIEIVLAGGNITATGSVNKNFKNELMQFDFNEKTIKQCKTFYGLIGSNSDSYDSIKRKVSSGYSLATV
ncbi:hypothetical protein KZH69_07615 [Flavobacterium sp. NAS39]|uniref:Uncharacterized protein n=2 Tax=Flavobacterium taihuense TaxID=2857508 RepID=A0ABS6XUI9_9FLAO|nr:hypothetical protein [Flavobacterium taihuense]